MCKTTMKPWIILMVCLTLQSSALSVEFAGGTGVLNDPYLINTTEQMNTIGAEPNDWDKHFKLMADIDLSGYVGRSVIIYLFYFLKGSKNERKSNLVNVVIFNGNFI